MAEQKEDFIKRLEAAKFKPEIAEISRDFFDYTGYPAPLKKYRLSFKSPNYSVEEMYFWLLGHATNDWGMPYSYKINDIFAASVGASTFGDLHSRMTAMQNQSMQMMATVSSMSRDLFKRVRELRQIRERLAYYVKADVKKSRKERADGPTIGAENTLKDIWITMVEGGGENPSSVYGMARKVNFTILPDLFMQAPVLKREEVHEYSNALDYNLAVKIALERKLYQYLIWKERTWEELDFKEKFQKKLIYQHYMTVRQYLVWIKPYLKNVKSLGMNENLMNTQGIVNSFESAIAEIEVLLYKPVGISEDPVLRKEIETMKSALDKLSDGPEKKKLSASASEKELILKRKCTCNSVVIMHFLYQTTPSMDYHAKDSWQQKGPIHIGKVDATLRAYSWTTENIDAYRKLKEDEEMDLLQSIDYTLKDEADLLGNDLKEILNEVRDNLGKTLYPDKKSGDDAKENKPENMGKVFSSVFDGLSELFVDPFFGKKAKSVRPPKKADLFKYNTDFKKFQTVAEKEAKNVAWQCYKNYKKAHRMITW
jgi:hypothetical protein